MREAISFKGVIVGTIVDVVGKQIALYAVLAYRIIRHQLYALPPAEQNGELQHLHGDPIVGTLNSVIASASRSSVGISRRGSPAITNG
jgi:hypothetical protein